MPCPCHQHRYALVKLIQPLEPAPTQCRLHCVTCAHSAVISWRAFVLIRGACPRVDLDPFGVLKSPARRRPIPAYLLMEV